jgi:hypothetical protein
VVLNFLLAGFAVKISMQRKRNLEIRRPCQLDNVFDVEWGYTEARSRWMMG